MKNLMIYTNPEKSFTGENIQGVKIHIDNSLDLGWKREDILLYTNFPYEYSGVKSKIVSDKHYLEWDKTSNKIFVINELLQNGLEKDLYWYHDLDAYQNEPITEEELNLGGKRFGLTGYGYKKQINGGSFFFDTRGDSMRLVNSVFNIWCKKTLEIVRTRADEKSMTDMTLRGIKWKHKSGKEWYDTIKVEGAIAWTELSPDGGEEALTWVEYEPLNITYNFGQRCPSLCYKHAQKPLKVLHFHPYYRFYPKDDTNINVFMHGNNRHKVPMMSDRLIKIFEKHGVI